MIMNIQYIDSLAKLNFKFGLTLSNRSLEICFTNLSPYGGDKSVMST